jgi:mannitol/fructose-specific phosphotransferase system IIA component (Ntr-type)
MKMKSRDVFSMISSSAQRQHQLKCIRNLISVAMREKFLNFFFFKFNFL